MAEPTISVALCTWNAERFVAEQLASIYGQTRPPTEVLIIDDASTDRTVAIVEELARNTPVPTRIERQAQNVGWVANVTCAVEHCRGAWVALSDHDDVWHPSKLELQAAQLASEVNFVFHDADLVDEHLRPLGARTLSDRERASLNSGAVYRTLLKYNVVQGATMLFRRAEFTWVLPIPTGVSFDAYLALCLAGAGRARFIDQPLLRYRQHGRNLLGAETQSGLRKWLARGLRARSRAATHLSSQLDKYVAARARLDERASVADLAALDEKIGHLKVRASLPPQRWKRVAPVARELFGGQYHRLGRGLASAARDLLV